MNYQELAHELYAFVDKINDHYVRITDFQGNIMLFIYKDGLFYFDYLAGQSYQNCKTILKFFNQDHKEWFKGVD